MIKLNFLLTSFLKENNQHGQVLLISITDFLSASLKVQVYVSKTIRNIKCHEIFAVVENASGW